MRARLLFLLGLTGPVLASTGCNAIFGIGSGQPETGGTGGTTSTTDTGGSSGTTDTGGSSGTTDTGGSTGGTTTGGTGGSTGGTTTGGTGGTTSTGGTGGSPTCTPSTATCEGAVLHACDANGFPEADVTCDVVAACDAAARKCIDVESYGRLAMSAGRGCAVLDDRTIKCWGTYGGGAIFANAPLMQPTAIPVPGVKARQVAMGAAFLCALQDDGTVTCWGNNDYGQLGFAPGGLEPPQTVPGLASAVEVAAGTGCACARLSDGTVDCWGQQDYGCLGTGHDVIGNQPTPGPVAGVTGAVQLRIGISGAPVCARLASGSVQCWFDQIKPQVLDGVDDAIDVAVGYHHVLIRSTTKGLLWSAPTGDGLAFLPATSYVAGNFTALSAGITALVKKSDGTLVSGYLGNQAQPDVPVAVVGLPPGDIAEIASASDYFVNNDAQCLRLAGQPLSSGVYCWGDDRFGGLGIGAPDYEPSPQDVPGVTGATTLFTSQQSTSVVLSDGSVAFWGNARGLIDNQYATPTPVPIADVDNTAVSTADVWGEAYLTKQGGGSLFLEGGVPVLNKKLLSSGFDDFTTMLGFGHYDVGLRANGQIIVYAGYDDANVNGVFGDGTVTTTADHTAAVPGVTATSIAAYGDDYNPEPAHICAVLAGGALQCWGHNYWGEIGNGMQGGDPVSTPFTVAMPGGQTVLSAAAGADFTCALVTNGKVYCWGNNTNGELGLPGVSASPAPLVAVTGLSNVTALTARGRHVCALLSNKTVMCWGANYFGQLGVGDFVDRQSPVLVPGLQNVVEVRAGTEHTCARRTDGTIACWGSSYNGQVGNGQWGRFDSPVHVMGL